MSNLLSLLQQTNKAVYIMGDYNINLLNVHTCPHIPDLVDMIYSYAFFPLITKPTRVTKLYITMRMFTTKILTRSQLS